MKKVFALIILLFATPALGEDMDDITAIKATKAAVFEAFVANDVDALIPYFHPDVIQIPNWGKTLAGRDAVEANYRASFADYNFEFITDRVENMEVMGDTAVHHGVYDLKITSKADGESFVRSGRYMVVMTRYDTSPTGWATLRELVQPAPDGERAAAD